LPEPKFEETGNFFKTIIFRARLTISPNLENVLELIKHDGIPLGSKEIAANLNIHQNTALKRLRQLEEKGLIHKQGSVPRVVPKDNLHEKFTAVEPVQNFQLKPFLHD